MSYLLPLGGALPLPETLSSKCINFYSSTVNLTPDGTNPDRTKVVLLNAQNSLVLNIAIPRPKHQIVFNCKVAGGPWLCEEKVSVEGVFKNKDAKITVLDELQDGVSVFHILVDGKTLHFYKRPTQVLGDVTSVEYYTSTTTPVFSNPIRVDTGERTSIGWQLAYFPLTSAQMAEESVNTPFDLVIIGSGIGGGVLIADLLDKNDRLSGSKSYFTSESTPHRVHKGVFGAAPPQDDKSLRILVIERGGLLFQTHSLNGPRPTSRGTYGQMNDFFYNQFKEQWAMDDETEKIWAGGAVYCLGGRSTVWGLFCPRISIDTFDTHFPQTVYRELNDKYLRMAEETVYISYPETRPLHRALIDQLNLREPSSNLPTTQWEWGRVASEFRDPKNFDFAMGAYSTVDRLVEAAMNDPKGEGKFKTILNSLVTRFEPQPEAGKSKTLTHVVVNDGTSEHKIKCNHAVLCAGTVESAAILLRSAGDATLKKAYGDDFIRNFGHVTDHYILYVTLPFFYRDMAKKDILGGVKLQTDITFKNIDNTTALANISLDASSFLPRQTVKDSQLPQFIIAYILPSALAADNKVELVGQQPRIKVGYAPDPYLEWKKAVLVDFAVDVMNKIAAALDVRFVKQGTYEAITTVTSQHINLGELGPGGVAHELGSLPMPDKSGMNGIVDSDLKLQYGWNNVHVCDLSVFPYSPAANPTLSLAALALRLSDKLVPDPTYQPIIVCNLTQSNVHVQMTLSRPTEPSFGPTTLWEIEAGQTETWKRTEKETLLVYSCPCAESFDVQMVYPGINAMIVTSPPAAVNCTCERRV